MTPNSTIITSSTVPTSVHPTPIFTSSTTEPAISRAQTTMSSDAVTEQLNTLTSLVVRLLAQNQELANGNQKRGQVIEGLVKQNQEQSLQIQDALTRIATQESENKALTIRVSKHEDQIHYNGKQITRLKKKNKALKLALESHMLRIKGTGESGSEEESEEEQLERRTKHRADQPAPPQYSSSPCEG